MNKATVIARKIVMEAKSKVVMEDINEHNCSLLEKMMLKCGPESHIPTHMAVDALLGKQ